MLVKVISRVLIGVNNKNHLIDINGHKYGIEMILGIIPNKKKKYNKKNKQKWILFLYRLLKLPHIAIIYVLYRSLLIIL
jgi:hypothetical protein